MNVMPDLFPGFAERRIQTEGAEIFPRSGGSGPPATLKRTCAGTRLRPSSPATARS
jgi:hypothetical protein